jgi:hypothetical protein
VQGPKSGARPVRAFASPTGRGSRTGTGTGTAVTTHTHTGERQANESHVSTPQVRAHSRSSDPAIKYRPEHGGSIRMTPLFSPTASPPAKAQLGSTATTVTSEDAHINLRFTGLTRTYRQASRDSISMSTSTHSDTPTQPVAGVSTHLEPIPSPAAPVGTTHSALAPSHRATPARHPRSMSLSVQSPAPIRTRASLSPLFRPMDTNPITPSGVNACVNVPPPHPSSHAPTLIPNTSLSALTNTPVTPLRPEESASHAFHLPPASAHMHVHPPSELHL